MKGMIETARSPTDLFKSMLAQCTLTAVDGREFVRTEKLKKWLNSKFTAPMPPESQSSGSTVPGIEDDEQLTDTRSQINTNTPKRGLMPLPIPPHVRDMTSEHIAANDFSQLYFKNFLSQEVIKNTQADAPAATQQSDPGVIPASSSDVINVEEENIQSLGYVETLRENDRIATQAGYLLSSVYDGVKFPVMPIHIDELATGEDSCLLVFCILLQMGHGDLIHFFRKFHIDDGHLPLDSSDLEPISSVSDSLVEDFRRLQWKYCPVRFDVGIDLNVQGNRVIPITKKEVINEGSTATLWYIEVPEELVSIKLRSAIPGSKPLMYGGLGFYYKFALKSFSSKSTHIGQQETMVFRLLRDDTGLIKHLGSYTQHISRTDRLENVAYHILLECGELGLDEYFVQRMPPTNTDEIESFWNSLSAIADGVAQLHELEPTKFADRWHGDIKPRNILLSQGQFKLADLGCFGGRAYGTVTYGAPEQYQAMTEKSLELSLAIDIWSLGCVFSLAATWIVLGDRGLKQFASLRQVAIGKIAQDQGPRGGNIRTPFLPQGDYFHNGKDVLDDVIHWHEYLRKSLRKSDAITGPILDIVDQYMLVSDPKSRVSAGRLCEKLKRIFLGKDRHNSSLPTVVEVLTETDGSKHYSLSSDSVDLGELKVQFPHSILWQRRSVVLNSLGCLIISATVDTTELEATHRFHLSKFQTPYAPDEYMEGLPNRIALELTEGHHDNCLQFAYDDSTAQDRDLSTLQEAHRTWQKRSMDNNVTTIEEELSPVMENAKDSERDISQVSSLPNLAPRRPSIAQVLMRIASHDSGVTVNEGYEASAATLTGGPKTYFFVPSLDFPPDGPIRLGSIITEPKKPEESLNLDQITKIPDNNVHFSHWFNWPQETEPGKSWMQNSLLSRMVGGKLSTILKYKEGTRPLAEDLETMAFTPTQTYIEEAMSHDSIRQYLENSQYKVPLYMITGVKIVRGGKLESERDSSSGISVNIPPELGLEGFNVEQPRSEGTSFAKMSDFVIAYRLTKITSSQKTRVKLGAILRGRPKKSSTFIMEDINGDEHGLEALL